MLNILHPPDTYQPSPCEVSKWGLKVGFLKFERIIVSEGVACDTYRPDVKIKLVDALKREVHMCLGDGE
jgi:hypothetical protein